MSDTLSLENKVAVVTGGSRGIGRAVAMELAARATGSPPRRGDSSVPNTFALNFEGGATDIKVFR